MEGNLTVNPGRRFVIKAVQNGYETLQEKVGVLRDSGKGPLVSDVISALLGNGRGQLVDAPEIQALVNRKGEEGPEENAFLVYLLEQGQSYVREESQPCSTIDDLEDLTGMTPEDKPCSSCAGGCSDLSDQDVSAALSNLLEMVA